MTNRASVALFAVLVGALVGAPTYAYPIQPVTLWQLVEESDTIVVATVIEVVQGFFPDDEGWSEDLARLAVEETWKGEEEGEIQVAFPGSLICPAPPRYLQDERVLAFLREEDNGLYRTVGLSYGSLYPPGDELDDLRVMVGHALEIRQQRRDAPSMPTPISWLVEAAARPGTRWHGLFELRPRADLVHSYYDGGSERHSRHRLKARHLEAIAAGFVAHPRLDRTFPMALAVLAGHPDSEVDRLAVAMIESLVAEESLPCWIGEAIGLTLARWGDPDPAARLTGLGRWCRSEDAPKVREIWTRGRRELGIPEVAPFEGGERRRLRVGEDTPS